MEPDEQNLDPNEQRPDPNPPPEAARNELNDMVNEAEGRNLQEELQQVADEADGRNLPPDVKDLFDLDQFPNETPDLTQTDFPMPEIDDPGIDITAQDQLLDLTPVRDSVPTPPTKLPVTNPGHKGVDPAKYRASQQSRARGGNALPTRQMQQDIDPEEAWDAKQRMDAGQPPNRVDPEAQHEELNQKLQANPQGNDKEQRDDLYKAMQDYFAAEREFRRRLIELWRAAKRDLDMDNAVLQQILNGFERSREGF